MPDVRVHENGSVVLLVPMTPAARAWITENVHTEPWQWLGGSLAIDWRFVPDLLDGMVDAGLTVGD